MPVTKKTIYNLIIGGLFTLFIASYLYQNYYKPRQIIKDYSFTTGQILKLKETGMRGMTTPGEFTYQVEGKSYTAQLRNLNACNYTSYDPANELMDYHYPVVYSNTDPTLADFLITPQSFEDYQLSFPDSLSTIYEKYWNCE